MLRTMLAVLTAVGVFACSLMLSGVALLGARFNYELLVDGVPLWLTPAAVLLLVMLAVAVVGIPAFGLWVGACMIADTVSDDPR